jgi:nitrite reductase/ring-hydroxylating ferredoxin subunit/uncharacterized membrane protein
MKTIANIKGHPIHPMLVAFPIAFLFGAFVCDVVGTLAGLSAWWKAGAYMALAGIGSAFIAAIPGLIDFLYSVPPRSSGKKRAAYHMIVNLSGVGLFIAAWVVRGSATAQPIVPVVLLEGAGIGLITVGGWLGGTLVYRNFIGPDHRHAHAGKWREQTAQAHEGQTVEAGAADELEAGQMKLVRVDGRRIVLARTAEGYVAFDDHCSHRGGSLADGVLIDACVQCLWHGSRFDVTTGRVVGGPAEQPILTYAVEQRHGKVWIKLQPNP